MAVGISALLFGSLLTSEFSKDALDKAGEILFGEKTKDIVQGIQERVHSHKGHLPSNHDLERAIRCAELTASIALIEHFWARHKFETRETSKPPFIEQALSTIHSKIGLCPTLTATPDDAIAAEIDRALDRALVSSIKEAKECLDTAARAEWDELAKGTNEDPPSGLREMYLGQIDPTTSWATFFVILMREQLKAKPRAYIAFSISRISNISDLMRRVLDTHARIEAGLGRIIEIVENEKRAEREDRLRRYKLPHAGSLWSAVHSPEDSKVIVASTSGIVTLWVGDAKGYEGFRTAVDTDDDATYAVFSPNGKFFSAAWWNGSVVHWHADKPFEQIVRFNHPGTVSCLAYARDSQQLAASGRDGSVSVWDLGKETLSFSFALNERRTMPNCVHFSPVDDILVTADAETGRVQTWDGKSGSPLATVDGHDGGAGCAYFSRRGDLIVSTGVSDCKVRVWNASDLAPLRTLSDGDGHKDIVWSADFSPDGERLVTASDDKTALVWEWRSGKVVRTLKHPRSVITASFSPQGDKIVTACYNGCAYVWDID